MLWSNVVKLMLNKQHLTESGFALILSYYASINKGMNKTLSLAFPNVIEAVKPILILPLNLNPYWVSGFVAGDGGFSRLRRLVLEKQAKFILIFMLLNILKI